MKWIDTLRGRDGSQPVADQAVLVDVPMPIEPEEFARRRNLIFALEDRLAATVAEAGVGEFDGDESGEGTCRLYLYGRDAAALFAAIEHELRGVLTGWGAAVTVRRGPPGTTSQHHDL